MDILGIWEHRYIGKQGGRDIKDMETRVYRKIEIQGHRGVGTQGRRFIGTQGFFRILVINHYIQRYIWTWRDGGIGTYGYSDIRTTEDFTE